MVVVIDELPLTGAAGETDVARAHVPAREDSALAKGLRAGEPAAFDQVVERYAPMVSRLAYRLLGWRGGDVDDVVQDVFVSVLRSARRFDGRSSLSTWITAITVNHCHSLRRRLAAKLRAMTAVFGRARSSRPWQDAADEPAIRGDESQRVREAVRRLKPADREVIVLHYLEHAGVEAIAGILGISRSAVEVRLHRARGRLKALLEQ
jgi:RNA polymerase sigma-70 factor (ECF subfamily)